LVHQARGMQTGSSSSPLPVPRSVTRKRPLTIRACLIFVVTLAADFALFRNAEARDQVQAAAVWLYAILIVFIWRYVPSPWDRLSYLALFLLPFAGILAAFAWFVVQVLLD
jgi:hypothetical protein